MSVTDFNEICEDIDTGVSPCSHYVKGGFCTLDKHFLCQEYLRRNMPRLSYSSIKEFVSCHRKFWYGHIMGLQMKEKSIRLTMGSIADEILRNLHSKDVEGYDFEAVIKAHINDNKSDDPDDQGIAELWALLGLVRGYVKKEYHMSKGTTQYAFSWQEPDYPEITGFIDNLQYEDHIGWEYKYTSKPDFYVRFTVDEQVTAYFIGAPFVERMTLRAIRVPELRLKQDEKAWDLADRVEKDFIRRPKYYINDQSYWRSEFNLKEYMDKAKFIAKEIMDYSDVGIDAFYKNAPVACWVGKNKCDFYSICENGVISEGVYSCRKKNSTR